jgi:hypothetical protein
MTREQLEDIQYECNVAALCALDKMLSQHLGQRSVWIKDEHLPGLLPALNRTIETVLREFGFSISEDAT